jgi:hypothetical protein
VLPRLIPIDDEDLAQYHLMPPNRAERMLSTPASQWRLYRDAYRLQAAMFGSSTRQYIYLNKGAFARALIARVRAEQAPGARGAASITIETPVSAAAPDAAREAELRRERPELWQFGDLYRSRRKPVVLLQMEGHSKPLLYAAMGDFNRVYAPYARVIFVRVPRQLTVDGCT